MRPLFFNKYESHFCCGLIEIGDLRLRESGEDEPGKIVEGHDLAHMATTTEEQGDQVWRLKRLGFKRAGSWKRENGRRITLWLRKPNRKLKKGTELCT